MLEFRDLVKRRYPIPPEADARPYLSPTLSRRRVFVSGGPDPRASMPAHAPAMRPCPARRRAILAGVYMRITRMVCKIPKMAPFRVCKIPRTPPFSVCKILDSGFTFDLKILFEEVEVLKRKACEAFAAWKSSNAGQAMLVAGARQVGKTYLIEKFAQEQYQNVVKFDLIARVFESFRGWMRSGLACCRVRGWPVFTISGSQMHRFDRCEAFRRLRKRLWAGSS